MTTHGPIYQMVENIIRTSEVDEAIGHLEDILPKIQELESKQGEDWISVEDRLPLAGEVVNMFSPESGGCVYSGYYSPVSGYGSLLFEGSINEDIYTLITHWQPLPLPLTK